MVIALPAPRASFALSFSTPLSTLATVEDITPTRPRCRLTLAERWADAMRRKEVGRG